MHYLSVPGCKKAIQNKSENQNNLDIKSSNVDNFIISVYSCFRAYRKKIDYRGIIIDMKI